MKSKYTPLRLILIATICALLALSTAACQRQPAPVPAPAAVCENCGSECGECENGCACAGADCTCCKCNSCIYYCDESCACGGACDKYACNCGDPDAFSREPDTAVTLWEGAVSVQDWELAVIFANADVGWPDIGEFTPDKPLDFLDKVTYGSGFRITYQGYEPPCLLFFPDLNGSEYRLEIQPGIVDGDTAVYTFEDILSIWMEAESFGYWESNRALDEIKAVAFASNDYPVGITKIELLYQE